MFNEAPLYENVVWQSADNTWNRGFYAMFYPYIDQFDDDAAEANFDEFRWVSLGHPTEQAARNVRPFSLGYEPGITDFADYYTDPETVATLDRMAQFYLYPELAEKFKQEQLKEARAKHFAKLAEQFERNYQYAGANVYVTLGNPETIHEYLGMFTTHTGKLKVDGDWLVLKDWDAPDIPVYNTVTKRFADNLHEIRQMKQPAR